MLLFIYFRRLQKTTGISITTKINNKNPHSTTKKSTTKKTYIPEALDIKFVCSLAPNTIAKIVLNFERREEEEKKAIIIRRLSRHDILVKKTLARGDNVL